ncbi:MAG: hypothetical protein GY846_25915 [Deltaproteobacteria bacterium]|nr:hypothetical protein [Deltaproteobacteria bacterium]
MDSERFDQVKVIAAENGIPMQEAKKAVCVPLSKKIDLGYVPPGAWEAYDLCKRQLSWYKTSPHFGQILVVSSRNLAPWGLVEEVRISNSKFRCRTFPGPDEQLALLDRESYQAAKPKAWEKIDSDEKKRNGRWLKIMGIHRLSYEELFVTHCANHANFIEPEYFLEGEEPIPYSLGKTTHLCSACLELFNIIGSEWKKKLVAPCPGAVLFAGMTSNRYYEVIQPSHVISNT